MEGKYLSPVQSDTISNVHVTAEGLLSKLTVAIDSWLPFSLQYFDVTSLPHTRLVALLFLGFVCLIYYLTRPSNIFIDLTGEKSDKFFKLPAKNDSMAKDLLVSRLRRDPNAKKFPLYPNGWFRILESWELGLERVKYVAALGENFAVFRKSDGKVHVVDAYCPHLGANMGIGGSVKNGCLECPFHGWQYDGETGKCKNIPYAKKIPEFAKVRTWKSVEVNHIIFVWYHAEGEEPSYEIQPFADIMDGSYTYRGRFEYLLDAHAEDLFQNFADNEHIDFLHAPRMLMVGADLEGSKRKWLPNFINLTQSTHWEPDADLPHMSRIQNELHIKLFNRITLIKSDAVSRSIGPGYIEATQSTSLGNTRFTLCITPVAPLTLRLTTRLYTRPFTILAGPITLHALKNGFEDDVMVWNYGKPRPQQNVIKEDGPIAHLRRWYNQFYSKNSPSLNCQETIY
nr:PREDICTED: cholesterol 7-desaturase-like isoform X1 [Bemisia tabaci]